MSKYKVGDKVALLSKKISIFPSREYWAPVGELMEVLEIRTEFSRTCVVVRYDLERDRADLVLEDDLIPEEIFNSPLFEALR